MTTASIEVTILKEVFAYIGTGITTVVLQLKLSKAIQLCQVSFLGPKVGLLCKLVSSYLLTSCTLLSYSCPPCCKVIGQIETLQ